MIGVEQQGDVHVLRLAHGKANALDLELCDALVRAFDDARDAAGVRAVVLTATGGIFSAGVDLPRLLEGGADYVRAFLPAMDRAFQTMFLFPKPLVTAVNGHAIAGGCLFTWCGDYRAMAAGGARIGVPELAVGVPFPPSALEIARFVMPPQHLQDVLYSGVSYPPEEALRRGMIDEVVAPERLLPAALERARAMAALSPPAFATTKGHVRGVVRERITLAGGARAAEIESVWCSPVTHAAIRAYVQRTFGRST